MIEVVELPRARAMQLQIAELDESMAQRECDGVRRAGGAEALTGILQMRVYGVLTDVEQQGDGALILTASDPLQTLALAWCERGTGQIFVVQLAP